LLPQFFNVIKRSCSWFSSWGFLKLIRSWELTSKTLRASKDDKKEKIINILIRSKQFGAGNLRFRYIVNIEAL